MSAETVTIITTVLGFAGGVFSWLFFKVVRPAMKFIAKHEDLSDSVNTIKEEVTHNGGGSLKDVVCNLMFSGSETNTSERRVIFVFINLFSD